MYRKIIILVAFILLILFGVWVYKATQSSPSAGSGQQTSLLGKLFPFGASTSAPTKTNPAQQNPQPGNATGGTTPAAVTPRLVEISNKMVAGFAVLPLPPVSTIPQYSITNPTGAPTPIGPQIPMVRFAERGTGYIYDVDAEGNNGTKASGTVIARTAEALFADNGATVILRYIKEDDQTVATFLGKIVPPPSGSTDDGTLTGNFLSDNIPDITVSPDQKNILYLLPLADGVAGIGMKSDGTAKKQLFQSSFSEWLLDWTKVGPVLTTKANADTPGYAYSVSSGGVFEKIIGSVNGLTTKMSPDGKNMLYSVSGGGGLDLHILHLADGSDVNTGLQTLPEKCVWGGDMITVYCGAPTAPPRASYPDDWYQGTVHFNDAFWQINSSTGATTQVDNGEGNNIDATNLGLDQNGTFLFFINKNNGSLWSLDLNPIPIAQ